MISPSLLPLDEIVNSPLPCMDNTNDQPRPPKTKTMKSREGESRHCMDVLPLNGS